MVVVEDDFDELFGDLDQNDEGKANVPKKIEKKDLMLSFDIKERKYQEDAKLQIKRNSILASSLQSHQSS